MWIQVKNMDGAWENRIAAEGEPAKAHIERLQKIYGEENVRTSPSTVDAAKALACGCQRSLGDALSLCPAHSAEFKRRAAATRATIADEMTRYIASQPLIQPVKVCLQYWCQRIKTGGR